MKALDNYANRKPTYAELLNSINDILGGSHYVAKLASECGLDQIPQLSCSHPLGNDNIYIVLFFFQCPGFKYSMNPYYTRSITLLTQRIMTDINKPFFM